ncbi:MAG: DUF11 domain-containing protein, partial [Deinococcales bacterium]|nr:DUF11 domain-containing protein [Chitinophagaceae bacterium]
METTALPQFLLQLRKKAANLFALFTITLFSQLQLIPKKSIAIIILMLVIFSNNVNAQVVQSFTPRFKTSQKGGIVYLANTAVGCAANPTTAGNSCKNGAAEFPPNGNYVNNDFNSAYIDIDGNASTFMSSSDSLNLANCSSITWAGLFWGASGGNSTNNRNIKIKVNNGAYQNISSDANFSNTTGYDSYHNFKNITSIVQAAGIKARFTVADIPFSTVGGSNLWGGWTIVVVYSNQLVGMKQLTVFDGLASVSGTTTVTVPITGFLTAPSGPVNIELGAVTFDGDRSYTGDQLLFNGEGSYINVSDALNTTNDVFNSTISNNGVLTPFRIPNLNNTSGLDADIFVPNNTSKNYLGNSRTSANLRLTTGGETYLTQVITTAIDVYEPDLNITKTVKDRFGNNKYLGTVNPGDTLEYTITVKNFGSDVSLNTFITDSIEKNAVFVPGSINIFKGPNLGVKSDASADDQAEYIAATNTVRVRVGTGANGTNGGSVINSTTGADSTVIKFKVTAQTDCFILLCDNIIDNTAIVTGTGQISGNTMNGSSNPFAFDANGCPISGATKTNIFIQNLNCTAPPDTSITTCASPTRTFAQLYPRPNYSFFNSSFVSVTSATTSGTFYALKTSYAGCVDTVVISLTVNAPNAGIDQSGICAGTNATLTGTNPATGTWSAQSGNPAGATLGGTSSGTTAVSFASTASGVYNFIYTANGCTDTMNVTVTAKPNAGANQSNICAGTNATLTGTNPATGSWSSQSGNPAGAIVGTTSSGIAAASFASTASGIYNFIYTANGCTDTMSVTVNAKPNAG